MQEQEIIRYLRLLGEELEALQVHQPIRLLMIGGAYMITQNIFVLKVIANRDKDLEDVQALIQLLRIKSWKQAEKLLRKYADKKLLDDYAEEINDTLTDIFG
jgi:hypothetical protein